MRAWIVLLSLLIASPAVSEQVIRDSNNRLIGRIKPGHSDRLEARDANGALRGYYDRSRDITYGPNGNMIGRGNQLPALLVQPPVDGRRSEIPSQWTPKYGPDGMTPNVEHGYSQSKPMKELSELYPKGLPEAVHYPEMNRTHLPDLGDSRGKAQQRHITRDDRKLTAIALLRVIERDDWAYQRWNNHVSGNWGSILVRPGISHYVDDKRCKMIVMEIHAGGVLDQQDQVVCQEGVNWKVVQAQHKW